MTSNYDMNSPDGFFYNNRGDYSEHYESMERNTRLQMDSIIGFIQSSPLEGERKDYVNALVKIGVEDFEARCHRRFGKLRDLRIQLQDALLTHFGEDEGDILDEPEKEKWSEAHVMAPLTIKPQIIERLQQQADEGVSDNKYMGRALYKNPARIILETIGEINYMQETIHEADMAGYFRDYTRLDEHFVNMTLDKVYSAAILKEAPPFIQIAYAEAEIARAGSRNSNAQAINAHVVAPEIMSLIDQGRQRASRQGTYMNPVQAAQEQTNVQG